MVFCASHHGIINIRIFGSHFLRKGLTKGPLDETKKLDKLNYPSDGWILGHGHRNTEFQTGGHLGKQQALVRPDSELELAKKEAPGA